MLSDLFTHNTASESGGADNKYNVPYAPEYLRPASKRKRNNLAGIVNQGATCYMNSLIQTLYFTREFRDSLFKLTADEIGLVPSTNEKVKVRVILIELQRLFANLMLSDQEACSTNRLTDSFGWSNNEEMQQHDVQELNRILFAAIEKSLINTNQSKLIQELYRGTYVNKIKCLSCLNVFEREEEFLDIPITVQGSDSLRTSLISSFSTREHLNGSNQYKCEKCDNQYKDAEKYCKLKNLPPILTFSLLRFTYDLRTYQRIKETSRFEFPLDIDLSEFIEREDASSAVDDAGATNYELYSVIIHSGNAYGGHYHTFIRDVDNLGLWTPLAAESNSSSGIHNNNNTSNGTNRTPTTTRQLSTHMNEAFLSELGMEQSPQMSNECKSSLTTSKEILLICSDELDPDFDEQSELVNLAYYQYESPLDLLTAFVYNKHKYESVDVDQLLDELNKSAASSWSNRFKSTCDTLSCFIRKHTDSFELSIDERWVKLRQHDRISIVSASSYKSKASMLESCLREVDGGGGGGGGEEEDCLPSYSQLYPSQTVTDDNQLIDKNNRSHWFDFDDSRALAIDSSMIASQFEGRESAYMLFYRRKSAAASATTTGNGEPDLLSYDENLRSHHAKCPEWLKYEIECENLALDTKRKEYQQRLNKYRIECFLDTDFYLEQDVLNIHPEFESKPFAIDVDKTTTRLSDLKELLIKHCTEESGGDSRRKATCLNYLLDANVNDSTIRLCGKVDSDFVGYFLVANLENDQQQNVYELCKQYEYKSYKVLFVFGSQPNKWPCGEKHIPIRLTVKYKNCGVQICESSFTFSRATLVHKLKQTIADYVESEFRRKFEEICDCLQFKFSFMHKSYLLQTEKVPIDDDIYTNRSIDELSLRNGDFIIVDSNVDSVVVNSGSGTEVSAAISYECAKSYPTTSFKLKIVNFLPNDDDLNVIQIEEMAPDELVANVKSLALTSFNLDSTTSETCLRYASNETINENEWLAKLLADDLNSTARPSKSLLIGATLHDDMPLGDVIPSNYYLNNANKKNELVMLLCAGTAPKLANHELSIRCSYETNSCSALDLSNAQLLTELIVDATQTTVEQLTKRIVEQMQLDPIEDASESDVQYILKTTNWLGDADTVLNNVKLTCKNADLKHNQLLLIAKGKLVPPNHLKIRLWISTESSSNDSQANQLENDENLDRDLAVLNGFIEQKYKSFRQLDELIVKCDMRLDELKVMVVDVVKKLRLLQQSEEDESTTIRLRTMRKIHASDSDEAYKSATAARFLMKKALIDEHKSLKQCHLNGEVDLCVQLLGDEQQQQQLNQGIVILNCVRISLKKRMIHKSTYREIHWNVNNGATLSSLKESIVKCYPDLLKSSDIFQMNVAKRQIEKYQWILLKETNDVIGNKSTTTQTQTQMTRPLGDSSNQQSNDSTAASFKKQKSVKVQNKINLKNAPYSLDDGDLIAFSLEQMDPDTTIESEHFMSNDDLSFYEKKNISAYELSKIRREQKKQQQSSDAFDIYVPKRSGARVEVGIKIDIDDY